MPLPGKYPGDANVFYAFIFILLDYMYCFQFHVLSVTTSDLVRSALSQLKPVVLLAGVTSPDARSALSRFKNGGNMNLEHYSKGNKICYIWDTGCRMYDTGYTMLWC